MFKGGYHFRKREYGVIAIALGLGILLVLIIPPLGWMIGCAAALIGVGIYCFKHF